MKCEFYTTGTFSAWRGTFILFIIFSVSIIFTLIPTLLVYDEYRTAVLISLTVFILSVIGLIFVRLFKGGVIRANEKQIIIYHNFMGRKAFACHIGYNEIENVEYQIEGVRNRFSFLYYELMLVIKKKSGKKIKLSVCLDIEEKFPMENPEEYKKYLNEQPMMNLYEYINKCLGAEQYE